MQVHDYEISGARLEMDPQADVTTDPPTRMIAPLLPEETEPPPIPILEPTFEIAGRRHALHPAKMVAAPARLVADLTDGDCVIRRATDLPFSGF